MSTAPFAWTHEKTRVDFDGRTLSVDDKELPLDQIERMSWYVERSTAQGSWNRLDAVVNLFANGKESTIRFRGDASKEEWGPWRPLWDQLEDLVVTEIAPRLLERTVRQIDSGALVEIGSGGAKGRGRLVVTSKTLQARGLFSKPIAWRDITGISGGDVETVIDGKRRTHRTGVISMTYDAWLLPLLWRHYGGG